MKAHEQMLVAANLLVIATGKNEFTAADIFNILECAGSKCKKSTIQAEMLRCCINCPRNNETPHDYFERIGVRDKEYMYQLVKN